MTTVMKPSTIDFIVNGMKEAAEAAERAKSSNGGNGPTVANSILLLKDGQRAIVRPTYNLGLSLPAMMHDKFKNDVNGQNKPIANLCAEPFGQPCAYCVNAKENKLEARREVFVPVYVFAVEQHEGGQWIPQFYKTEEDGQQVHKPIKGFRFIRLKMGSPILSTFMTIFNDEEYSNDITTCNFVVHRVGSGLDTTYSAVPRPPKPMNPDLKAAIEPHQALEERLRLVYPPVVLKTSAQQPVPQSAQPQAVESFDNEY